MLAEQIEQRGSLTIEALKSDVERARDYWARPAEPLAIGKSYRQLMAVKGRGELPEGEESYAVETFVRDAMRHGLSQGDLDKGMEVYRDHGGPFLPRTYGEWAKAQEGHVFVLGAQRVERYAAVVRDIEARNNDTTPPSQTRHETDMEGRTRDVMDLLDLTRRHKARCRFNLSALPCVNDEMHSMMMRVSSLEPSIRTEFENEAISAAQLVVNMKRKAA